MKPKQKFGKRNAIELLIQAKRKALENDPIWDFEPIPFVPIPKLEDTDPILAEKILKRLNSSNRYIV